MFELHHEILELLRSITTLHHDVHTHHRIIMASLQEVKDAQQAELQAIVDLAIRLDNLPQPVATAVDLDDLVSTAQANKAAIDAIAPALTV